VEGGRSHTEHVGRRPRSAAARDRGVDVGRRDLTGRRLAQHPGHPEVGQYRATVGREDDVARREVAVDDAVRVRVRQRGGDRRDRRHDLARPQPAATGEQRGHAAALEQLQDERHAGGAPTARLVHDLDQPDQVRMVQLTQERCLAGLPLGIAVDQHLDRDGRSSAPRNGAPDLPRSAPAEQRLEDVPRDEGRVGGGGRIGCGHDRER
jgi:hypothetical protein